KNPFTREDDERLARYLALRIPDYESGGRRGDNVYKELYCAYSEDPKEYAWVTRHPWQSWRNRYNKSVTRFNDMIDIYVKLEKPEYKQAYRLQRKPQGWHFMDASGEGNEEQSGSPLKRHRVDSSDSPENRVLRRSLAGKGKETMVSEDGSGTHREPSSPHYEVIPSSESGPSNRTPVKVYAHGSRKRPRVSPIYDHEPYNSQATLVGTNYQTQESRPQKTTVSDLQLQPHERSKVTWRGTSVGAQQDRSPLLTEEPDAFAASTRIFGADASTKMVSTSPRHRPMARKTAQRDKTPPGSATTVPSVPSYRITRSVEPSILPSKTRQSEMVTEPLTTLPLLERSVNEDYQPLVEVPETHSLDLIEETLEEERSVEDLLVNNMSGRSQVTEDASQIRTKAQNATEDNADEPTSLDSDDAQIDNWLRQPQTRSQIHLSPKELCAKLRRWHTLFTFFFMFEKPNHAEGAEGAVVVDKVATG
ncbi:hypothetical protein C0993_010677, partial [Termitomyces sp. T159_Od127]